MYFFFINKNEILLFCNLLYIWDIFPCHLYVVFVFKFPPYATNEIGKVTGINRRELGHGKYKSVYVHGILTET